MHHDHHIDIEMNDPPMTDLLVGTISASSSRLAWLMAVVGTANKFGMLQTKLTKTIALHLGVLKDDAKKLIPHAPALAFLDWGLLAPYVGHDLLQLSRSLYDKSARDHVLKSRYQILKRFIKFSTSMVFCGKEYMEWALIDLGPGAVFLAAPAFVAVSVLDILDESRKITKLERDIKQAEMQRNENTQYMDFLRKAQQEIEAENSRQSLSSRHINVKDFLNRKLASVDNESKQASAEEKVSFSQENITANKKFLLRAIDSAEKLDNQCDFSIECEINTVKLKNKMLETKKSLYRNLQKFHYKKRNISIGFALGGALVLALSCSPPGCASLVVGAAIATVLFIVRKSLDKYYLPKKELSELDVSEKSLLLKNKLDLYLDGKIAHFSRKMTFFCRNDPEKKQRYEQVKRKLDGIFKENSLENCQVNKILKQISIVIFELKEMKGTNTITCVTKTFKSDKLSSLTERFFKDKELMSAGLSKNVLRNDERVPLLRGG